MTPGVRFGETGCEGTEWESETSVRCLIGHVGRGSRRVAVTGAGVSASLTEAWSADSPSLRSLLTERSVGRMEIISAGSNYLDGSFYAVASNGITVRGNTFVNASGEIDKLVMVERGFDLNPLPSNWIIAHLGQDSVRQDAVSYTHLTLPTICSV